MSQVGIITDTIACLPPEIVKEYGISIIPIGFTLDGKAYLDQVDMTPEEFWRRFPAVKKYTTGAPPPDVIINVFKEAARSANELVCTVVSKAMSATYADVIQANERFKSENPGTDIEIIDSNTAAGAQGFIALEAARAAKAGKSKSEIIAVMKDMMPRVKWVCGLQTLRYLIRSGRAPKTAYIGEILNVKPIIASLHGTGVVENAGRVRGQQKCWERMVEMVGENCDASKPLHVMVHYTDNIDEGRKLMEMVETRYKPIEKYFTPYSCAITGHTGPCTAISFYT